MDQDQTAAPHCSDLAPPCLPLRLQIFEGTTKNNHFVIMRFKVS